MPRTKTPRKDFDPTPYVEALKAVKGHEYLEHEVKWEGNVPFIVAKFRMADGRVKWTSTVVFAGEPETQLSNLTATTQEAFDQLHPWRIH